MNQVKKTSGTEIINAVQGSIIDRTKTYLAAHIVTERHERMYLFLIGAALLQLKAETPHGQFDQVKQHFFGDAQRSRLGRAMLYCESVRYLAKDKFPTIGNLKQPEFFLTNGDLPEEKREVLAVEIDEAAHGKGVMETISEYRHKLRPPHKSSPQDRAEEEKHDADEFAKTILGALNMAQSESGLERLQHCTDSLVQLIEDARIELGHALAPIIKGRKAFKSSRR